MRKLWYWLLSLIPPDIINDYAHEELDLLSKDEWHDEMAEMQAEYRASRD